jgi:hypothetical protein
MFGHKEVWDRPQERASNMWIGDMGKRGFLEGLIITVRMTK